MDMKEELARLARHGLPPLIAYLVGRGLIPAELQQPITEAALAMLAAAAAWWASRARDVKRK